MNVGSVLVAVPVGGPKLAQIELDKMALGEHLTGENNSDPAVYLSRLEERIRNENFLDDNSHNEGLCPVLLFKGRSQAAVIAAPSPSTMEPKNTHRARIVRQKDKILSIAKGASATATRHLVAFAAPAIQAMRPPRGKKPSSRSRQKVLLKTTLCAI